MWFAVGKEIYIGGFSNCCSKIRMPHLASSFRGTDTFRESSPAAEHTAEIGYLVLYNCTEDLLIGKPTLDVLGVVIGKNVIELRHFVIRVPTVLPDDLTASYGVFLRLVFNISLAPPSSDQSCVGFGS